MNEAVRNINVKLNDRKTLKKGLKTKWLWNSKNLRFIHKCFGLFITLPHGLGFVPWIQNFVAWYYTTSRWLGYLDQSRDPRHSCHMFFVAVRFPSGIWCFSWGDEVLHHCHRCRDPVRAVVLDLIQQSNIQRSETSSRNSRRSRAVTTHKFQTEEEC